MTMDKPQTFADLVLHTAIGTLDLVEVLDLPVDFGSHVTEPPPVRCAHNHGAEDGPGFGCRETHIGDCLRNEIAETLEDLVKLYVRGDKLVMVTRDEVPEVWRRAQRLLGHPTDGDPAQLDTGIDLPVKFGTVPPYKPKRD